MSSYCAIADSRKGGHKLKVERDLSKEERNEGKLGVCDPVSELIHVSSLKNTIS